MLVLKVCIVLIISNKNNGTFDDFFVFFPDFEKQSRNSNENKNLEVFALAL